MPTYRTAIAVPGKHDVRRDCMWRSHAGHSDTATAFVPGSVARTAGVGRSAGVGAGYARPDRGPADRADRCATDSATGGSRASKSGTIGAALAEAVGVGDAESGNDHAGTDSTPVPATNPAPARASPAPAPAAPTPVVSTPGANPSAPAPQYYNSTDYSILFGVLDYNARRGTWRLRYADFGDEDRYGGSVTLDDVGRQMDGYCQRPIRARRGRIGQSGIATTPARPTGSRTCGR